MLHCFAGLVVQRPQVVTGLGCSSQSSHHMVHLTTMMKRSMQTFVISAFRQRYCAPLITSFFRLQFLFINYCSLHHLNFARLCLFVIISFLFIFLVLANAEFAFAETSVVVFFNYLSKLFHFATSSREKGYTSCAIWVMV